MAKMTIQQAVKLLGGDIQSLCLGVCSGDLQIETPKGEIITSKKIIPDDFQEGGVLFGSVIDEGCLSTWQRMFVQVCEDESGEIFLQHILKDAPRDSLRTVKDFQNIPKVVPLSDLARTPQLPTGAEKPHPAPLPVVPPQQFTRQKEANDYLKKLAQSMPKGDFEKLLQDVGTLQQTINDNLERFYGNVRADVLSTDPGKQGRRNIEIANRVNYFLQNKRE